MEELNSSLSEDIHLYGEDIMASKAHVNMLAYTKLIKNNEAKEIIKGLNQIKSEIENNTFEFDASLEDIHMNIEVRLKQIIGEVAGKLHTGRSRNDQVATDVRLWLINYCHKVDKALSSLIISLCDKIAKNGSIIMPGYTHLQVAQPICFGHHLGAYNESFLRDRHRLGNCFNRMNVSPLGAAALAGTPHKIDSLHTAKSLNFKHPMFNAMDAVSSRDHIMEYLAILTIIANNLSRLSEDLILWSSQAFAFIEFPEAYSSVSSIMPQKRNPDAAEIIRSRSSRNLSAFVNLVHIMKGLPQSYNKDMQEDKKQIFDASENILICLLTMKNIISGIKPLPDKMLSALEKGYPTATDLADWLTSKGVPFRQAYTKVKSIIVKLSKNNMPLHTLSKSELEDIHPDLPKQADDILSVEKACYRRNSFGGASPNISLKRCKDVKNLAKLDLYKFLKTFCK